MFHPDLASQLRSQCGVVVPLVKDRLRHTRNLDNYRSITVSYVICKVVELCISNKLDDLLWSHPLLNKRIITVWF